MKDYIRILIDFIKKYYIAILIFSLYLIITYLFKIITCPLKLITGFPCPSCGMTRAGFSVLKLDFISAFNYNPLIFILPIILFIIIFKERPIINKFYKSKVLWISLIILIFAIYIIRLIFIFPKYPMDYEENSLLGLIISLINKISQF